MEPHHQDGVPQGSCQRLRLSCLAGPLVLWPTPKSSRHFHCMNKTTGLALAAGLASGFGQQNRLLFWKGLPRKKPHEQCDSFERLSPVSGYHRTGFTGSAPLVSERAGGNRRRHRTCRANSSRTASVISGHGHSDSEGLSFCHAWIHPLGHCFSGKPPGVVPSRGPGRVRSWPPAPISGLSGFPGLGGGGGQGVPWRGG